MTLRPVATRWFELLTIGADVPPALETLARTGAVELEVEAGTTARRLMPDTDDLLKNFNELARTHGTHWPPPAPSARRPDHPRRLLETAWARLTAWRSEADPIIRDIEAAAGRIRDLERLRTALADIGADCPDLSELAGAGPLLAARLFRLPAGIRLGAVAPPTLVQSFEGAGAGYALVVGRHDRVTEIEAQVPGMKGEVVPLPDWLPATPADAVAAIAERLDRAAEARRDGEAALAALSARHDVAGALGDFALIEWLGRHAGDIAGSERLAWITGWTSDETGDGLRAALDAREVRYLLRLLPAPAGADAPLVLRNPPWARAFEVFAGMLGMPGRDEADPSLLLAVIAPLMFGFMFGDVGQGLVLIGAGLWLGPRLPVMRLLVPGGIAAAGFGVLFGSVFCVEGLIPALWLHPLAAPATLLAAALAGGVALLLLGLLIDAYQALWRGEIADWAIRRGGFVLAYVAVLTAFVWGPAAWGALLGAIWFVAAAAALAEHDRARDAGVAAAEFLEEIAQLLVNTVSFVRVGAFALAHAGLSAAIVGVAEVFGGVGWAVMLVAGNLLVLTLEGLVVGIQTTRLILFEFFIRFLRGSGRPFRPLDPPRFDRAPAAEKL